MNAQNRAKIVKKFLQCKKALLYSMSKPAKITVPVFIMGCGRSGTTMMIDIFHRDYRTDSLDENNQKIAKNFMLVPGQIPKAISESRAPILVMKPILNSFDALKLLNEYDNSKVIWLLRDHKDMVASSIKKFGTVVSNYMKDLIQNKTGDNWLSFGVPSDTLNVLSKMDSNNFTPYDWLALGWWSVNRTIMLDQLFESDRFILVQYESLVQSPKQVLKRVYDFIDLEYRNKTAKYIHQASVGKGKNISLNSIVNEMCINMAEKLHQYSIYK